MRLPKPIILILAAVSSGLLLSLLYAPFYYWPLGWICIVPFLWAVSAAKTRLAATFLGLTTGLVFRLTSIYWVTIVVMEHGHLEFHFAVVALLCLSTYLSLYPATIAFLLRGPLKRIGPIAFFLAPFIWVSGELILTHLLTGFPWNLLGYSQISFLPAAQIADITGVYGVSFLLVAVNSAIAFAIIKKPRWNAAYLRPLAITGIILVFCLGYGIWKLVDQGEEGEKFKVAVIQDDMENNTRRAAHRDAKAYGELIAYYLDNTRKAARNRADVVVWPEGALLNIDMNPPTGVIEREITALVRKEKTWLLLGSNDYFNGGAYLYNGAFSIAPDNEGETAGEYIKVHLTPFGEYVPYQEVLGWVPQVVPEISDFAAGDEIKPIKLRDGKVGVAICYEVIFPDLVRRFTANRATLLATISNDAWFGFSAANDQHFDHAVMRAIENRRYLVRAAATGVSGVIEPSGEVQLRTPIYERTVACGEVAMKKGLTVYAAVGDAFSYLCVLLTLLSLILLRYTKGLQTEDQLPSEEKRKNG